METNDNAHLTIDFKVEKNSAIVITDPRVDFLVLIKGSLHCRLSGVLLS